MYNNNWTSGHLMNCLDPDFFDGKEALIEQNLCHITNTGVTLMIFIFNNYRFRASSSVCLDHRATRRKTPPH